MPERFLDTDHFDAAQADQMLDLYCKTLGDLGYEPRPYPDLDVKIGVNILRGATYDLLNHALWMCGEARDFVRRGRWSKAHRWIGMIQGLLFACGVFSINQLKEHNRTIPGDDRR
jgi:hypothetical protein